MKRIKRRITLLRLVLLSIVVAALLFSIRQYQKLHQESGHPRDYQAIQAEGILRVAAEYNSISYYIDKKDTVKITGFDYELIHSFAKEKNLKVEMAPVMSLEERLKGLNSGQYDIVTFGLVSTSEFKDSLLLTSPVALNKQVLVQRKKRGDKDSTYIESQLNLAQRTLWVIKDSPAILRIRNLSNEIGDTIFIHEEAMYGPEQLISRVAHGEIDYVVCDEAIALIAADSLPQIDIKTPISFTQFYSWGVSKHSPVLLDSLNKWIKKMRQTKKYTDLYNNYYKKK